jgi:hypothetical protein
LAGKGRFGALLGVQAMILLQAMDSLASVKKLVWSLPDKHGMAIFSKFFH